jgi:aminoglycoside 3-N-acetyltransferase I
LNHPKSLKSSVSAIPWGISAIPSYLCAMNSIQPTLQIQRLTPADVPLFQALIEIYQTVFEREDPPAVDALYLQTVLRNPTFIVWVALQDHQVVGGLTAFELPMYYTAASEIFIYDLGVHPKFQRQGIGRHLIASIQDYGRSIGAQTVFVPAHEDDTEALEFYRSTGGDAEKVVHFNYDLGS